jgi:predicted nucleic acid-binding protein
MPDGPVVLNNTPLVALWSIGLELPLTGTLGLLLAAKEARLIESVAFLIDQIRHAGLYLRNDLVNRVLELAGESSPKRSE